MRYYYPSGIIMAFDDSCPTGWTRFTALDSGFVKGKAVYGATGGGGHTHSFDPPAVNTSASSDDFNSDPGSGVNAAEDGHRHSVDRPSTTSTSTNPNPPWIGVVFCKKD